MKVNLSVTLDERDLRRVRSGAYQRGGRATRAEVRVWAQRLILSAIETLPEPKTRPCNTSRRKAIQAAGEQAAALEMALECVNCGLVKAEHLGTLRRVCPVSKKVRPGSLFKAKETTV